jgi:cysteinyl-tRNA synthetase
MIAGARVEVAPYKRNPMDFVLWKPSSDDLPGWDSPWGRGRPGWHIECSAMAHELLGASFDIHGGGIDLAFPHHENEIAQSCCANGTDQMASVWMHNEMLLVEGKKMSKSLGNFFTVRDLLDQGIPGEVIRYVFLMTHYRKPMDWTAEKAAQAEKTLENWRSLTSNLHPTPLSDVAPDPELVAALAQDLNTHSALTILNKMRTEPQKLLDNARFLGFLSDEFREIATADGASDGVDGHYGNALTLLSDRLRDLRNAAMQTKDFAQVDRLKSALIAAGVEVRMSKDGVELVPGLDFDPAGLEGL